jgi:hypothetical protein
VVRPAGPLQVEELRHVETENAAVEEDESAEGLILRRSRDPALDGERIEERGDLGGAKGARVSATLEGNERARPVNIGFLGAGGVMEAADGLPDGLDEGPGLRFGGPRQGARDHWRGGDGEGGVGLVKDHRPGTGASCQVETIFVEKDAKRRWHGRCERGVATGIRRSTAAA